MKRNVSIEPEHYSQLVAPLSERLADPTQTLTVKHTALRKLTSYTDFHQVWRHCRMHGGGNDGIVHQYQRPERLNEFIAVKVPQFSSAGIDLKREVLHLAERMSEIIMCKLFRDIALALDHLHNGLDKRHVHNNFKPQNALAPRTIGYSEKNRLPEEPVFKLSDFARLTPFPLPNAQHP